jgi:hypothetical protein
LCPFCAHFAPDSPTINPHETLNVVKSAHSNRISTNFRRSPIPHYPIFLLLFFYHCFLLFYAITQKKEEEKKKRRKEKKKRKEEKKKKGTLGNEGGSLKVGFVPFQFYQLGRFLTWALNALKCVLALG